MIPQILYFIGTALTWAGIGSLLLALLKGVDVALSPEGPARTSSKAALTKFAITGLVCLGLTLVIPMEEGTWRAAGVASGKMRFPLVWPVLPFYAWAALGALIFGLNGLVREALRTSSGMKADPAISARGKRLFNSGIWILVSLVFAYLYKSGLAEGKPGDEISFARGGVYLASSQVISLIALAILSVVLMAIAGRAVKSRNIAGTVLAQVMLLIGSLVFGLPFIWALITSFKEDRDMSSKDGLVWVPRVQEVVPYKNPAKPIYATNFMGRSVQAEITKREGDKVFLDVQKPNVLRGRTVETTQDQIKEIDRDGLVMTGNYQGTDFKGYIIDDNPNGTKLLKVQSPASLKDKTIEMPFDKLEPVRNIGLRYQNYPDALDYLPVETVYGLVYLRNTLVLVVLSTIGTILSSSLVAYAFARLKFPGKETMWKILLSTMMLPGAVTLLPQFLIFKSLGWIDTLQPLWVPAFFSNAYFVFMLRQFFSNVPMELEDASKMDGCSYLKSYWSIMLPQVKPALAVVAIWTFMGVWNNFQGPLVYINSPEKMPITYALQLFQGDRFGEPGLLMAFSVLTILPVLLLFFVAQKYFIEGVSLSGLGGR